MDLFELITAELAQFSAETEYEPVQALRQLSREDYQNPERYLPVFLSVAKLPTPLNKLFDLCLGSLLLEKQCDEAAEVNGENSAESDVHQILVVANESGLFKETIEHLNFSEVPANQAITRLIKA